MIRLAICDDCKHFINTMRLEIMDHDDIELVGECNRAVDCLPMLSNCQPDVLLLDIQMETSSAGIEILPKIKAHFPDLTIIMITVSEIDEDIFNAITNGANNYILKDDYDEFILYTDNKCQMHLLANKKLNKIKDIKKIINYSSAIRLEFFNESNEEIKKIIDEVNHQLSI